jgi:hypothetical protein
VEGWNQVTKILNNNNNNNNNNLKFCFIDFQILAQTYLVGIINNNIVIFFIKEGFVAFKECIENSFFLSVLYKTIFYLYNEDNAKNITLNKSYVDNFISYF